MKKRYLIIILIITIVLITLINKNVYAVATKNILFIGNSKTYYSNLPSKVYNLAKLDNSPNLPDLAVTGVISGGKTLQFFYENRQNYQALLSKKWNYVVLQEQTDYALKDGYIDKFKGGASNLIKYLKNKGKVDKNTTIIYNATCVTAGSTNSYDIKRLKTDQEKTNKHYRVVKDYVEQQTGIKGKIAYSGSNFISCISERIVKD